jgi:hypothetical protein
MPLAPGVFEFPMISFFLVSTLMTGSSAACWFLACPLR